MARPGTLEPADLEGRAAMLDLNAGRFSTCLASKKYDAAIQGELRHGIDLGVSGTPAYFVNGRMLSGARPVEAFAEVIDAELAAE
jgi:protein-disulfide isomerase